MTLLLPQAENVSHLAVVFYQIQEYDVLALVLDGQVQWVLRLVFEHLVQKLSVHVSKAGCVQLILG